MGWLDFAEAFARGYVSERGVAGTVEDIADVTSKIFGSTDNNQAAETYNNDEDDESTDMELLQQDWEHTEESIEELVEEEKFNKAYGCLDSFFNRYNMPHNWLYNIIRARIVFKEWDKIVFELFPNGAVEENTQCASLHKSCRKLLRKVEHEGVPNDYWKSRYIDLVEWVEVTESTIEDFVNENKTKAQIKKLIGEHDIQKCFDLADNLTDDGSRDFFYALQIYSDLFRLALNDPDNHLEFVAKNIQEYKTDIEKCKISYLAQEKATQDKDNIIIAEKVVESTMKLLKKVEKAIDAASIKSANTATGTITEAENEYLEEVRACYADDNVITERERRLLDKLRKSLGISETRAQELEDMCNPYSLSDEEQEYADELKEILADGIVSDRERRLLDKLRKSLGISETRAQEIESIIKSK